VPTEKAAQILGVGPGEIGLLIHSEVIHGVISTGGRLSICVKSIISGISSHVDDNNARE
jgi:hypothetical protein